MQARWMALLTLLLAFVALPKSARADQSGAHTVPVAVLAFDSEDAEAQADALTGALRSRIRAAQGWSLIDTTQSLGMLAAALKCPGKPLSADCQVKIGEQIKAERFIYGYVTKGPAGQVTAEVHLHQKGKPDTLFKESYSDNLRDQNDDNLRKVAQRVLDRFGGNAVGSVVVKVEGPAATDGGEVVVDGDKKVPLKNGVARIELAPGSHSIEVTAGNATTKRNILVQAGKETPVDIATTSAVEPPPPESKGFPTKKVIGGVALSVGVILGALAVHQYLQFREFNDRGDRLKGDVREFEAPCDPGGNKEFCDLDKKSMTSSGIAIGAGAAGVVAIGTGIVLLLSGGSRERAQNGHETDKKTRITPTFGGLAISGSF